jgi:hypothetical protein
VLALDEVRGHLGGLRVVERGRPGGCVRLHVLRGRGDEVVLGDALALRDVGERLTAGEGGLKIAGVHAERLGHPR